MRSQITTTLDTMIGTGVPVVSVAPIDLEAGDRPVPLHVRISAPDTGRDLPVIVFSHGNGWSLDGYAPLVDFWASHGFVVIQPTHLDSRRYGIGFGDPAFSGIWRHRITDMKNILDQLDTVETALPGLRGRMDRTRIAAVGHSWGGHTVQSLLGARVLDADGRAGEDFTDSRVTAGVLLATTGTGEDLSLFAREHLSFMNPAFAELHTPTLVVAGDHDRSQMSSRGPDWFTDAYTLGPGATDLLTLFGGEHGLGGIVGYEVAETTDENPERVAVVQRMTTAYLRSALDPADNRWASAKSALNENGDTVGKVDSKRPSPSFGLVT